MHINAADSRSKKLELNHWKWKPYSLLLALKKGVVSYLFLVLKVGVLVLSLKGKDEYDPFL